jgi:O-antigen ligase
MKQTGNLQAYWVRRDLRNQVLVCLLISLVAVFLGKGLAEGNWLYLALLPFGIVIWFYPVQSALGSLAALIPFEAIPASSGGGGGKSLTFFVGAAAAAILLALGLISNRLGKPAAGAAWWAFFALWAVLTELWAIDPSAVVARMPTVAAFTLLYLSAACFRTCERELNAVAVLATLGGAAAALLSVYRFAADSYFHAASVRGTLTGEDNPNAFALTLLLPASFALAAVWSAVTWWKRLAALAALFLTCVGVMLTMSRGGLLSLATLIGIHLWRFRHKARRLQPLAVLLCLVLLAMPKVFYTRLSNAIATGGAGRTYIWEAGWVALKSYGLQGAGLDNFPVVYNEFAGMGHKFAGLSRDPHNIYLAATVELGVVGAFLLGVAIWVQLRDARRVRMSMPEPPPLLVTCEAACWATLVAGLFGQFLWQKTFWMCWILLSIVTQLERSRANFVAKPRYEAAFSPLRYSREI